MDLAHVPDGVNPMRVAVARAHPAPKSVAFVGAEGMINVIREGQFEERIVAGGRWVELTRIRLQEAFPDVAHRATFVTEWFEDYRMGLGQFDLVVSSFSLHHVEDKATLFRRVRESIKSGGTFRFADQLSGGTDVNDTLMWKSLLDFMQAPGNCTETEVQSMMDHSKAHDHHTPLAVHFKLLQDAGFVGIDCVWRDAMWTVITADVA